MRNSPALASLIIGSAAEDRFSVPNPSRIRKAELTTLNTKTLTPRKHYEPLKYLLENDFFHEDAREFILSILSVLEVRKVQTKASAKHEKSSNPKKLPRGAKIPIRYFQTKKSEDEKVVEESDNLKNVAVLHDSSEESCGDDSACSDSGGSESDCKD